MSWTPELKGRGRRSWIERIVSPNKVIFNPGDCVEYTERRDEKGYGIIDRFREIASPDGIRLQVRLLLLYHPESVGVEGADAELLLSHFLEYVPATALSEQKLTVVNSEPTDQETAKTRSFFIYRAINHQNKVKGPVKLLETAEATSFGVVSLFRGERDSPLKGKVSTPKTHKTYGSRDPQTVTPQRLFPDSLSASRAESSRSESDSDSRESWGSGSESQSELSESESQDSGSPLDNSDTDVPKPSPSPRKRNVRPQQQQSPKKARGRPENRNNSSQKHDTKPLLLPSTPRKPRTLEKPDLQARVSLHISSVPDSLPCREDEFSAVFLALENAIGAETGSCIYISGTPGTGKTATVMEAITQLYLRVEDGELQKFEFIDINGMRLAHSTAAYDLLWEAVSAAMGNSAKKRLSTANIVSSLESEFRRKNRERSPVVVLLDELDMMVTKEQKLMYNFFNWPSLPHSKLVVIAIANSMDLPERQLSNRISSRLGLTRITFKGYTFDQLRQIIMGRLEEIDIIDADAVEYAARKIAGVNGDARRVLDLIRRAVELGGGNRVGLEEVRHAIAENHATPMTAYLQRLPVSGKVLLCGLLARVRRTRNTEAPLSSVLSQAEELVPLAKKANLIKKVLYADEKRLNGFQFVVNELVEAGVIVRQAIQGEATPKIRLLITQQALKEALESDIDVGGML